MRVRAALVALLCAACADNLLPVARYTIEPEGRVERGARTLLRPSLDGIPALSGGAAWRTGPDDAIRADSATREGLWVTFLATGAAQVEVELGGRTTQRTFTVAPSPELVAVLRGPDGNADLWRFALDGTGLTRLTTEPLDDVEPAAARGTDRIVFRSLRGGGSALWSMRRDGTDVRRLSAAPADAQQPALAQDGAALAFLAGDPPKLFAAAADGGGAARVTTTFGFPGSIEQVPAWLPGTTRLAFTSTDSVVSTVVLIDRTGTNPRRISGTAAAFQPAVSVGGRVAFVGLAANGRTRVRTWTAPDTLRTVTPVAEFDDAEPTWIGEERIAYVALVPGGAELRVADLVYSRFGPRRIPLPAGVVPSQPEALP
ncbi:MAG: hypothetical protein NW201_04855 [Gemmatimonadales bacterium]|nr:hypothetical protein [Gemmatimonadales bacterium]